MTEWYDDEEVVEFVSGCPVDDCNNVNKQIHWRHKGCNKKEYINSDGQIICTDCNRKMGFYECTYNCGDHENYRPPSRNSQRLIAAFAILGRLEDSGGKKFTKKLLNALIDQCDDD